MCKGRRHGPGDKNRVILSHEEHKGRRDGSYRLKGRRIEETLT